MSGVWSAGQLLASLGELRHGVSVYNAESTVIANFLLQTGLIGLGRVEGGLQSGLIAILFLQPIYRLPTSNLAWELTTKVLGILMQSS